MDEAHPATAAQAGLGLVAEALLDGSPAPPSPSADPWQAWWISYRLARPAPELGLHTRASSQTCVQCRSQAADLARHRPPLHTDTLGSVCADRCLRSWCERMRSPAAHPGWPRTRLALALIKPDAPREAIVTALTRHYRVLERVELLLANDDVRRLYPEAYGSGFVAAVDAYLTGGPAHALVLCDDQDRAPLDLKQRIRAQVGAERLRNHLHMADNPGETFADIAHLFGTTVLTGLYDTYERDHAPARMDHYRAVLGQPSPSSGGLHPRST